MNKPSKQEMGSDVLTDLNKVGVDSDLPVELQGKTLTQAVASTFQYANDIKTKWANAITLKGVSASPDETSDSLATKTGQIPTPKKTASGVATSSTGTLQFVTQNDGTVSMYYITVTGLDFTPRRIECVIEGNTAITVVNTDFNYYTPGAKPTQIRSSLGTTASYIQNVSPAVIAYGTFKVPINVSGNQVQWFATE